METVGQLQKIIKRHETKVIYDDDTIKVVRPLTYAAVKLYGYGTRICIAWNDDTWWKFYNKCGVILYIINKKSEHKSKFSKVFMWLPYPKFLPLYRDFGTTIEDVASRYKVDDTLYKQICLGYSNSVDEIGIVKLTNEFEFYDTENDRNFMPVKFEQNSKL